MSTVQEPADTSGILQLKPTVVRASAGTGKTYQLTARMLRILLQGAPPETILATTFTRKAAGEILTRVLLTLARAGDEGNPKAWKDLQQQVGLPTLPQSRCRSLLRELVASIHRLRVSTLDSVFSTLARSLPFELGLPPAWRLTDEIEEEWLRESAINELISDAESSELRSLLAMLGGGRVVRNIAREIDQVIQSTYSKQRLCEGDLWNEVKPSKLPANSDLQSMLMAFRGAELPQPSLVKKLGEIADVMEQGQQDDLIEATLVINIATARTTNSEVKFGRSKFPEELQTHFDVLYAALKSRMLGVLSGQNQATGSLLSIYESAIVSLKESQRSLGFDDVAVRLAKHFTSLTAGPDDDLLQRRLDGAIDHLLLDEFQDTAPVQWAVLRPIALRTTEPNDEAGAEEAMSVSRSFFCVGDTKQAIYGFRGGVAEIFDAVTDQLDGVDEIPQNESYRSSPVILDFVTDAFQNLSRHPIATSKGLLDDPATHHAESVQRFARSFPNHIAAKSDLPGHVRILTSASPKDLGEKPSKADLKAACFDRAAKVIEELHRDAPAASIGVLTRSRKAAAEMMYRLDSLGLAISQEGGNPLTDSSAVELVLSALMMVEHPGDRRWRFHVERSPLRQALFVDSVDDVSEDQFKSTVDSLRQMLSDRGLVETVTAIANALVPVCDDNDTLRLRQLTQLATSYQLIASPRLSDFVRLVRSKGVEQPRAATIRVMTVHASKGLEFDSVVLPELDEYLVRSSGGCIVDAPQFDQPPTGMTRYVNKKRRHFLSKRWQEAFGRADAADMTEALCLMYVAMTRARHSLQLVIQPTRKSGDSSGTPASLLLHAIKDLGDPTQGETVIHESGDADWTSKIELAAAIDPAVSRVETKLSFCKGTAS